MLRTTSHRIQIWLYCHLGIVFIALSLLLCWGSGILAWQMTDNFVFLPLVTFLVTIISSVVIALYIRVKYPAEETDDKIVSVPNMGVTNKQVAGWKTANLYYDPKDYSISFQALTGAQYLVEDIAVCENGIEHTAPVLNCTCGFYAFNKRRKAVLAAIDNRAHVLLQVEAYGKIIQHKKGWRAAEQVVMKVYAIDRCSYCQRSGITSLSTETITALLCDNCAKRHNTLPLSELANKLKTDVTICSPQAW